MYCYRWPFFLNEVCDRETMKHFFKIAPMKDIVQIEFNLNIIKKHLVSVNENNIADIIPTTLPFGPGHKKFEWNKLFDKHLQVSADTVKRAICDNIQQNNFKRASSDNKKHSKYDKTDFLMDTNEFSKHNAKKYSSSDEESEDTFSPPKQKYVSRSSFITADNKIDREAISKQAEEEKNAFFKRLSERRPTVHEKSHEDNSDTNPFTSRHKKKSPREERQREERPRLHVKFKSAR